MQANGLPHEGIILRFGARDHRIDFRALTGKHVTVYSQHLLVRDLIAARLAAGGTILFEADAVSLHDIDTTQPRIRIARPAPSTKLICDVIAGCDGFHGISRPAIEPHLQIFERDYPFGWLGILADAPPSSAELVYANHDRGFALLSMRSSSVSRLYLQCAPDEDLDGWSDDRIWAELQTRFSREGGFTLQEGRITQKGHHADAQLRRRADAAWPAVPGRRFRAHRASHRGEGPQPRRRRRRRAGASGGGILPARPDRAARCLFRDVPRPRLEGAAIFLVDDLDAAPLRGARRFRAARAACRTGVCDVVGGCLDSLAENYVGLKLPV